MSDELQVPVSTTVKYADGSETVINYNEIEPAVAQPEVAEEAVVEEEKPAEEAIETPLEEVPVSSESEAVVEAVVE